MLYGGVWVGQALLSEAVIIPGWCSVRGCHVHVNDHCLPILLLQAFDVLCMLNVALAAVAEVEASLTSQTLCASASLSPSFCLSLSDTNS